MEEKYGITINKWFKQLISTICEEKLIIILAINQNESLL